MLVDSLKLKKNSMIYFLMRILKRHKLSVIRDLQVTGSEYPSDMAHVDLLVHSEDGAKMGMIQVVPSVIHARLVLDLHCYRGEAKSNVSVFIIGKDCTEIARTMANGFGIRVLEFGQLGSFNWNHIFN